MKGIELKMLMTTWLLQIFHLFFISNVPLKCKFDKTERWNFLQFNICNKQFHFALQQLIHSNNKTWKKLNHKRIKIDLFYNHKTWLNKAYFVDVSSNWIAHFEKTSYIQLIFLFFISNLKRSNLELVT